MKTEKSFAESANFGEHDVDFSKGEKYHYLHKHSYLEHLIILTIILQNILQVPDAMIPLPWEFHSCLSGMHKSLNVMPTP